MKSYFGNALLLLSLAIPFAGAQPMAQTGTAAEAPHATQPAPLKALKGRTMGNDFVVNLVSPLSAMEMALLYRDIETRLAEVNAKMSTWQADSAISRFNVAPANTPFAIDAEMHRVVAEALRIGQLSQGALDITVGPLVDLWGFGANGRARHVPTPQELTETLALVGSDKIVLANTTLVKTTEGTRIDLSAIAKGYGVDAVAQVLDGHNIKNYLVDIGGELRFKGERAPNQPWQIAVEKPYAITTGVMARIQGHDLAVATSGDYRNYFTEDGAHYGHVINPATGRPTMRDIVSATVVADSCMTADALATAFMVMGKDDALALAEKHGIPLLIITDHFGQFKTAHSSAFKRYLN